MKQPSKSRFGSRLVQTFSAGGDVTSLVALRDNTLAIGSFKGDISIWNPLGAVKLRILRGHNEVIQDMRLLRDGSVASASEDNTIKIWKTETGELLRTLNGHTNWVTCVEQLKEGSLLASGSMDRTVKIWNATTGKLLVNFMMDQVVYSFALLRSGALASLVHGDEIKVVIIDEASGDVLRTIEDIYTSFICLAVLRDGTLAVGQKNALITIWDVESGKIIRTLEGT
jgi:WD40 repeat protein